MTKREMANLRRLELENSELRDQVKRQIEVYRDQSIELIELRSTIELLRELLLACQKRRTELHRTRMDRMQ